KTEKKPFIDYKAGQTSQYEYTFSIQYPDSADFTLESVQRVNTVVKKTNAEITVDDNTLSNLVKIQVTVEEGSPHIQQQNTWFRYDDGYFTEYANSRSLGTISIPKIANNDPHEYQAFIQSQMKKFSPERMITGNFDIESFEADSIRLRTDPRLVHPRQFEIGKQWTTFSDPWLSKSRITEKKVVTDNDGFIDSYVIETENFLESSEFTYHTRFDSRGLVKRIVILEQTFRNEYGESIGEGITRSVVKRIGFSE
ncbi:MAG: hypothetical protein EA363_00900, partial [Balneolaceae bacterium]